MYTFPANRLLAAIDAVRLYQRSDISNSHMFAHRLRVAALFPAVFPAYANGRLTYQSGLLA